MIRWYADNTELHGIWEARIPDILFFGGIFVDEKSRDDLFSIMRDVKSTYRKEADFPIKWNLRDLQKYYQNRSLIALYEKLLKDSIDWRSKIFRCASSANFTIIVSLIKCYGKDRGVLLDTREKVTRYAFSNALMRVGLYVRDLIPGPTELILDWPSGGQRGLFDDEYRSAYQRGKTADDSIKYFCPPLKDLGFSDSILYSGMQDCSLLQFSDLIVGATREMVEEALGKKRDSLGLSLIRSIKDKFRGAPDCIIGQGMSLAPTKGEFYNILKEKIVKLLFLSS